MLLTNTQVSRLHKTFTSNSAANINLSKTELHKIGQSGGFLSRLLGPLLKTGMPLIGNVIKSLPKRILIPLGFTAAAPSTDTAIHKKMFGSGRIAKDSDCTQHSDLALHTALIISNEVIEDIMKIVKFLGESGLLMKGVNKTIKNEPKVQ